VVGWAKVVTTPPDLDLVHGKTSDLTDLKKRFRPRPLAQFLLEEHSTHRDAPRLLPYVRAEAAPSKTPGRRLCSVTGLLGKYRDLSSGLAYATHAAAEQLKDTPPSWLQLSGNAPYYEAVRIIKKEAT